MIDGVPAFGASNDGHGAPDHYYPLKGQSRDDFDRNYARVEAYAKTLPQMKAFGVMLDQTVETLVDGALHTHLVTKDLQRLLKRAVAFVRTGKVYTLSLRGKKPAQLSDGDWQRIESQIKDGTILNRVPFEQALALYRQIAQE
ncbi:MAG TPA: hypothetical protein VGQ52_13855 [Gemmatimonadaceae bacterium]|nr:hypothetical protein [Gemmatimonadaceae bacterium]